MDDHPTTKVRSLIDDWIRQIPEFGGITIGADVRPGDQRVSPGSYRVRLWRGTDRGWRWVDGVIKSYDADDPAKGEIVTSKLNHLLRRLWRDDGHRTHRTT